MGYFNGITDSNFKTDDKGRILFYPWGVLGKGYILTDDSIKRKIRRFKKRYHIISLPCLATIAVVVLTGWVECLILFPIFPLWYWFKTAQLLKGAHFVTDTKFGLKESYTFSSKSHNIVTLWLMLIVSVLFTLAGIIVFIFDKSAWLFGVICILFFGACSCAIGYMIKVKKTT